MNDLRITVCSAYDYEGGAGRAARRLFNGLESIGYDPILFAQERTDFQNKNIKKYLYNNPFLFRKLLRRSSPIIEKLCKESLLKDKDAFHSFPFLPDFQSKNINHLNEISDVINLHWINNGFLNAWSISNLTKPVVWTLHDMWPFCGTEHYLSSQETHNKDFLISRFSKNLKRRLFSKIKSLTIVSPSSWLAKKAQESLFFEGRKITVIPNGVDTDLYKPFSKKMAKEFFNIPAHNKVVLFASSAGLKDKRKGFYHLAPILSRVKDSFSNTDSVMLMSLGTKNQEIFGFPVPIYSMGHIKDEPLLRLLYCAADVVVLPSEEDNLPNVILESFACGTPVVAFSVGGIPDLVNTQTGCLSDFQNYDMFAKGITTILNESEESRVDYLRNLVEEKYTIQRQAQKYVNLFNEIKYT
jgi:glycosyltransferase involved in cell wall biosynthesis